jgi:hypothetical protein
MAMVRYIIESRGWYLKGDPAMIRPTWTSDETRANHYDSVNAAERALKQAKPYMKPAAFKTAFVVEAATVS